MTERQPTGQDNLENRERPLAGKVALITGSSRDIGAEIAKALAIEGVNIVGNYRDKKKRADKVQETLRSFGVTSEFVQADITNEDDRKKLKETVENLFGGKLDILVLNASGPSRDINVTAANSLVDMFLPIMPRGSIIVLMQSVPGHFEPQLNELNIPEFYRPIAKAKHEGEESLRSRIKEFKEKGISFIVVCPPEVSDTANMKVFRYRYDALISDKQAKISGMLGLPSAVTKKQVGKKVAELLKQKDLPMGYVELFELIFS